MKRTKGALKAMRQNIRRRARNAVVRTSLRKLRVSFRKLVEKKKNVEAVGALPALYRQLDKAARKGIIHKRKASRLKSRIAKKAGALTQ